MLVKKSSLYPSCLRPLQKKAMRRRKDSPNEISQLINQSNQPNHSLVCIPARVVQINATQCQVRVTPLVKNSILQIHIFQLLF
jgi:hypothetical protein